ncbi:hypothetical protein M404DRAFT_628073 [Pisolithus tinctorius Marx 270]|uniref:Uncharacterized protein n=1 Tax=Pisolithus tinctorius Marx 270 TaxID=870435 RepID=A0A0C3NBL0_PISTI|nr:hypothetical protein M404DRAFT_628073 [Pisolithus tinctorius Marx 270]
MIKKTMTSAMARQDSKRGRVNACHSHAQLCRRRRDREGEEGSCGTEERHECSRWDDLESAPDSLRDSTDAIPSMNTSRRVGYTTSDGKTSSYIFFWRVMQPRTPQTGCGLIQKNNSRVQ